MRAEPLRSEPPRSEPPRAEPPRPGAPRPEEDRPGEDRRESGRTEEPAAFWNSARPLADDIPPPVEPIYPDRDKPREQEAPAPEPLPPAPEPEPEEGSSWFSNPVVPSPEPEPEDSGDNAPEPGVLVGELVQDSADAADDSSSPEPTSEEEEPATEEPSSSSPAEPADEPGDQDEGVSASPDTEVTVVPGVPRYHRSECILIRFMGEDDLQTMTLQSAADSGATPCRACQPEHEASPE